MPVSVSYSFCVIGPILPPLIPTHSPFQQSLPTGDTTAAVPVPNASSSLPARAAAKTSSIESRLSSAS